MKRKNRKRLAKEAEIARKEARGDFSHLKDRKTGKLTAAPLPQPTLPKIGFNDDLYSDSGSNAGGHYPPQKNNNNIPYGYPPPPSLSNRNIYPYASSDSESLHSIPAHPSHALQASHRNGSYADSIHSTDGLTAMAAPFGYSSESSTQLVGPDGRILRAPSYRTMPSEQSLTGLAGNGGEWDEKYGSSSYPEFDRTGTPKPARAMTGGGGGGHRQDSIDSYSGNGNGNASGLGYAKGMSWENQPQTQQQQYGGGWEESYGGYPQHQQQYYGYQEEELRAPSRNQSRGPQPSSRDDGNNMAGRGWGGGYGR